MVVGTWVLGSWDLARLSQEDAVTVISCGFSPLILQVFVKKYILGYLAVLTVKGDLLCFFNFYDLKTLS